MGPGVVKVALISIQCEVIPCALLCSRTKVDLNFIVFISGPIPTQPAYDLSEGRPTVIEYNQSK